MHKKNSFDEFRVVRGLLSVIFTLCSLTSVSGSAATISFNNGATEWNNVQSWVGLKVPTSNDVAYFNTSTAFTANMKQNESILGLLFNQSGSVTHNDDIFYSLILGASGLTVTTGTVSIGSTTTVGRVQVALGTSQTWTNNSVGTLTIQNAVSNGANHLTVGGTGNTIIKGGIGGGNGGITKNGFGTLTLTGTNTYSGATTISEGTLQIGSGGTTGTLGTGNVTNNSKLVINRSNAITVSNLISGSGSLTKSGTNTLTLSGANTYSGETKISAGALVVSNALALQSSTLDYTNNGGAISFSSGITAYTFGGLAGDKNLALTNAGGVAIALTVGNNSNDTIYSGTLSAGGSLIKTGTGTLTLTGTNTYSGTTTINAGTLQIGNAGTLGTGHITNYGTLAFSRSDDVTMGNVISGVGSLTKSGTNTLTLSGANTYSGETKISAGILVVSNALALQSSTLDYTNNGGAIRFSSGISAYTLGGLAGDKNLALTNAGGTAIALTIGNNASNTTYSGVLSAGGSLIKTGAGTLTLTGTNTYSGATTISDGTLQIGNGGMAGTLGSGNVTNNSRLVFNHSDDVTVSNHISGSGTLTKTGANTLTLTGTNNYSGATVISGGTLKIGSGGTTGTLGTGNVTNNGILDFDRSDAVTVGNAISGSGSLKKSGTNTLTLTAASTYTNTTLVSSGGLIVNGSLQSHMITVASGATLGGTGTVQAVTLDPGALLIAGAGSNKLIFNSELILSAGSTNFMGILSESLYDVVKGTGANALTAAGSFIFDFTGNTTVTNGSTFAVLQNWKSMKLDGATFKAIGLDAGKSLDTSKLALDGTIKVIPEPTAISLIGLGGLLTLLISRLRQRRV